MSLGELTVPVTQKLSFCGASLVFSSAVGEFCALALFAVKMSKNCVRVLALVTAAVM